MILKNSVEDVKEKNLIKILKGSLMSIIITIVLLLIFSALLAYTNLNESISTYVIIGVMGISIIIGSLMSTKKVKKNGMVNGGLVGLIYILVIYILSSIFAVTFGGINVYTIIMFIVAIITGILGGIIGVNL